MAYYKHHVFVCTNKRNDGRSSCQDFQAQELRDHMKARSKELGLLGKGEIRINSAGCLNRCDEGPVMVVYPQETWYTFMDQDDIDEIIDEHLIKGNEVERLKLEDD